MKIMNFYFKIQLNSLLDILQIKVIKWTHNLKFSLTLFQEQLNEVLDAMFERKVQPGDHVIDQGDDGDNFYVIDK